MAGAMKKMAVYLGLVEDDIDEYGPDGTDRNARYDREYDRYDEAVAQQESRSERSRARVEAPSVTTLPPRRSLDAEPLPSTAAAGELYRITTLHPRTYNDAKTIGLEFREGTPVIMNLTEMEDADAKRIVDFAAGLVFGMRGTLERVTNKVFLLSPNNVDVGAETKARIAEGGFFNQS
jgi:cell division inhibitor SepF